MNRYYCDVLIIGGGGAALRSALEVVDTDDQLKVIIVTKGGLGRSGVTALACSDRMAFHTTLPYTEPGGEDNWRYHSDDIYRLGGYVSDEDLAQILARNSGEAFEYLDKLGVPFAKSEEGKADQFRTDGSDYARACYTGPYTASDIEIALIEEVVMRYDRIEIVDNFMIVDLITSGDRVIGAWGLREVDNEKWLDDNIALFRAKAVILATGGAGGAYKFNVFPQGMTGDGYAMAYRAGAELVNMELIQIGLSSLETELACSGSMLRAVPRILNDEGREFLRDYLPPDVSRVEIFNLIFAKGSSWPVSYEQPTKTIDIAIYKEIMAGRRVYFDYSDNPRGFRLGLLDDDLYKRYMEEIVLEIGLEFRERNPLFRLMEINPTLVEWLKGRGIDLSIIGNLEVVPAIQHFLGGVKIRERANTTLRGLYAAGECAGGQHGANRPGGNSLLDCQVFGKIAGRESALEAKSLKEFEPLPQEQIEMIYNRVKSLLEASEGEEATEVREKLREILYRTASIVRTQEGLAEGLEALEHLKTKGLSVDDKGLNYALETINLLEVGKMIMRAAKMRNESRGAHLMFASDRDNIPLRRDDENWRRYIVIKKEEGKMELEAREPVKLT